ncbi:hypothetical protein ACQ4PT_046320 [Festuca glaucescens]
MPQHAAKLKRPLDRLNELPEEILLNILERVDMLDALRTCILSKRMLRFPAMLLRFDIDIGSLTLYHDKASHGYNIGHIARYNNVVASVTEKMMCARNPEVPIIHKLRVRCYLRPDECLPITRAFASIMATQEVDHAELVLLVEKTFLQCKYEDLLCNAKRFNTCLGDCSAAFAGLTRLWLGSMRFGELDILNILTTCKRLEYLRLSFCDAARRSVLLIEHDRLVELIFEQGKFEAVHLNRVPKLQRMTCAAWHYPVYPLYFGYVPQLSNISLTKRGGSLCMDLQLSRLLANVPSISDLHLNFLSEKIWVVLECPKLLAPMLGRLKIVNLDNLPEGCDIAWTMFVLEAAPSLMELCITVWDHWCYMVTDQELRRKHGYCEKANVEWQPSSSGFKHKNLVKLTIHGFQPDENMAQYVRRVMEIAVNIGKISLLDGKTCEQCRDLDPKIKVCPSAYPTTSQEKDMLRVVITKGLRMAASLGVIIFSS